MPRRAHGEGTIFRDGTRWIAAISIRGADGKRKRVKRVARTQREAKARLEELRAEAARGASSFNHETVGEYLSGWLEEVVRPNRRPKTYESHESIVRVHLIPVLGEIPLRHLGPQHVQTMLNRILAEGRAPRTVIHVRATLHAALKHAERWELVSRNAAAAATPPRAKSAPPAIPTLEEARKLLTAIRGDRLETLYLIALTIGLRQAEVLGLRWDDLALDEGRLSVNQTLQRFDGAYHLVDPKTERSRRTIAMPRQLVISLRAHRVRQLEERLAAGDEWQDTWGLIFTNELGGPLRGSTVTARLQRILIRAGLPRFRFHALRHACATLMLAQGASPRVVMEVLGHSTIYTTMNVYTHVLPNLEREAADRMGAFLEESGQESRPAGG